MTETAKTPRSRGMKPFSARLCGRLGVRTALTEQELAEAVEKRLPARSIDALVGAGLSEAEVHQLIIPRRTLAHRVAGSQPLSRDESDRAVRVARITLLAEQVFGEKERSWRWLRKAKRRFRGRTPLEMLRTETGGRLVEEILVQLDDGMAA